MNFNKEILKPKDVAEILKVTTKTLIDWDKKGKLVAHRNIHDRRYYTRDQINEFLCVENIGKFSLSGAYLSHYCFIIIQAIVAKEFINIFSAACKLCRRWTYWHCDAYNSPKSPVYSCCACCYAFFIKFPLFYKNSYIKLQKFLKFIIILLTS